MPDEAGAAATRGPASPRCPGSPGPGVPAWIDGLDTDLPGTVNAVHAAPPHLGEGASITATGPGSCLCFQDFHV